MKMTIADVDNLFATDEKGKFINLVIPEDKLGRSMNLIGRSPLDLSLDETVRVKKYASKLYEEAEH